MKHDPYALTALIRNDDFIAWVRNPDAASEARWQLFLELNPDKKKVLDEARGYVNLLADNTGKNKATSAQTNKMWRVLESHLHEEHLIDPSRRDVVRGWQWLRIAASVALILGIMSGSYWFLTKQNEAGNKSPLSRFRSQNTDVWIERYNDTGKPMTIFLADGSSVVLQPGGRLHYASRDGLNKREVTLVGKAFFEIEKDVKRPFLVYTEGLATKVLGTSFLIDAPEGLREIKVEVKNREDLCLCIRWPFFP